MKKFNVKINGVAYEVEVDEVKTAVAAVKAAAPAAAPAKPAAPAPAAAPAAKAEVGAGDTAVNAPMPGKIVKIITEVGKQVKAGDVLVVLEAMKMQNEITAPKAGVVKGINVTAGQGVKPGEVLVVLS
ncbi:MAG: biotin/lipoyl-binding protein [Pelosinus sp.]|nr:biotin/lipoyl-binding protein [Pelosinus sp.]